MKVAFIHDVKLKEVNGNYYCLEVFSKEILEVFSEIYLLVRVENASSKEIKNMIQINSDKVHVYKFPEYNTLKKMILNYKLRIKAIKNVLREVDCAIIKVPSFIGMNAIKECKKIKKNYMLEVVGCAFDALWNFGNIKGKVLAPFMFFINKRLIKNAETVLYVSNEFLQNRYPNHKNNIGLSSVEISKVDKEILNKRIEKIKNSNINSKIVIGLIGSLNAEYKGVETAIKSVKILCEKYDVELRILGEGDSSKYEKQSELLFIKDLIIFDGIRKSGKEVFNWLDNIDIYIQPSYTEAHGRAVVEAMSRGCAIASSNVGGLKELVSKEFTHNPKNYKKLSYDIERLILNKELRIETSIYYFNKAKNYYEDILTVKRKIFYKSFKDTIKQ